MKMRLFYHHVGLIGATEDFKKTVFAKVALAVAEDNIPQDDPLRDELLSNLRSQFPSGSFNCWGVPEGAKFVIKNLSPGDYVLLVESTSPDGGSVPALCHVKAYWYHALRSLSLALWGDEKYPYIFFFDTEELNLEWD